MEREEGWVLRLVRADACGGASKGGKSLAREEGLCLLPPPLSCPSSRSLSGAAGVFGGGVCGYSLVQPPPGCPAAPKACSACGGADGTRLAAASCLGTAGSSWLPLAVGHPPGTPQVCPTGPPPPALPRTGLRPSASALPLEPCS